MEEREGGAGASHTTIPRCATMQTYKQDCTNFSNFIIYIYMLFLPVLWYAPVGPASTNVDGDLVFSVKKRCRTPTMR